LVNKPSLFHLERRQGVWKNDLLPDSGYAGEKKVERRDGFCLPIFQKKRKDSFDMSREIWLKAIGLICWHCFFGCETSKKLL
jgi:hypothetical protein